MSVGVLEEDAFSNVSFVGNVLQCPASQYGYEEHIGNSVRDVYCERLTLRFVAFRRCHTGVVSCTDTPP